MKLVAVACLCLVEVGASAAPAPPTLPSAYQIIQREGRLAFTDDSSLYDFEKNGSFYSKPLGLSGRTIEGTWKLAAANDFAGSLVVQGTWGWVNGVSAINDRREMTVSVYPRPRQLKKKEDEAFLFSAQSTPQRETLHSCYFVIDELIALPKPPLPKQRIP